MLLRAAIFARVLSACCYLYLLRLPAVVDHYINDLDYAAHL